MTAATTSLQLGLALKDEGMNYATACKNELLDKVREAMRLQAFWGPVTADDAYAWLIKEDYEIDALGAAAGSIFSGDPAFVFTGQWVTSKRPSNHARPIRSWRLR